MVWENQDFYNEPFLEYYWVLGEEMQWLKQEKAIGKNSVPVLLDGIEEKLKGTVESGIQVVI